jgi:hypothetical protein
MNKWILPDTKLDLQFPFRWQIDCPGDMVVSGLSTTYMEAVDTMTHVARLVRYTRANIYDNWISTKMAPPT